MTQASMRADISISIAYLFSISVAYNCLFILLAERGRKKMTYAMFLFLL